MNCDSCGVRVSSQGFLGGSIVCHECAKAKRKGDTETLKERQEKYGGDNTRFAEDHPPTYDR
jgi:hypothetical protein